MRDTVTKRQQEVVDTIRVFLRQHGYSPAIRDLMVRLHIRSPNGIVSHLRVLRKKGLIEYQDHVARSIRIPGESIQQPVGWMVPCPPGREFDYQLCYDRDEAEARAEEFRVEAAADTWTITPLFPGEPVELTDAEQLPESAAPRPAHA